MGVAAGILIILISIAHTIYGEKIQIPALKKITTDLVIIGSQRIMIFQGGLLLMFVGIIQVLVSTDVIQLHGISVYFPVGIVILNFCIALIITLLFHREVFNVAIPQFVIFSIIILLQLLSI